MDCKEFREKLDLYIDHELSAEASGAARLHVQECSRCRRAEEALLQLRRGVKQVVKSHEPPPDLLPNVRALMQSRARKTMSLQRNSWLDHLPLWRERIMLPVPILALLLFVAVGLVFVVDRQLRRSPEAGQGLSQTHAEQPNNDAVDFTRFDRGGRASLIKVKR
jgi:predicted anti-sigma-YlaC factor YlaD